MKVVFISSILPQGHYSQYLASGLSDIHDLDLIFYAEKNPDVLKIKNCGQVKAVWSKSHRYIFQILRELRRDKPDVIHLQQELNMYGGVSTAALFPLLLLVLKILRYKLVITVHAAVFKKQIDKEFIHLFNRNPLFTRPTFLKSFFSYIFKAISVLANKVVVHTNLKKDILVKDYSMNASKIKIIPISIPERKINNGQKGAYFLYFGYMVRRKGLGYALEGFKKFVENNSNTDYKLVLAGGVIEGQEKALQEIEDLILDYGLKDKVVIKGFVEESELDELYRHATAAVIPAKVSMGSSGPLFHASSFGKCAIASKIGHFLEDIDDRKTGVLT